VVRHKRFPSRVNSRGDWGLYQTRAYCGGGGICSGQPSERAARNGQFGSRRDSLPISTMSAWPLRMIWSACAGSVINPTAAVSNPQSLRTRSAKETWKLGPTGMLAVATPPPVLQSIRSTPSRRRIRHRATVCSKSQPPSTQSVQESRIVKGRCYGQTALIACVVSRRNRMRFSKLPP
jgi:hypothetical protein